VSMVSYGNAILYTFYRGRENQEGRSKVEVLHWGGDAFRFDACTMRTHASRCIVSLCFLCGVGYDTRRAYCLSVHY